MGSAMTPRLAGARRREAAGTNRLPRPGAEHRARRRGRSAMVRAMARPRPLPAVWRDRAASPRWNRSKMWVRSASGTPGPSSRDLEPDGVGVGLQPQLDGARGVGRARCRAGCAPAAAAPSRSPRTGRRRDGRRVDAYGARRSEPVPPPRARCRRGPPGWAVGEGEPASAAARKSRSRTRCSISAVPASSSGTSEPGRPSPGGPGRSRAAPAAWPAGSGGRGRCRRRRPAGGRPGRLEPVEHPVHGDRQPPDLVVGRRSGTRRSRSASVIVSTSVRMASTRRSARPRTSQVAGASRSSSSRHPDRAGTRAACAAGLVHRLHAGADVHRDRSVWDRRRGLPRPGSARSRGRRGVDGAADLVRRRVDGRDRRPAR